MTTSHATIAALALAQSSRITYREARRKLSTVASKILAFPAREEEKPVEKKELKTLAFRRPIRVIGTNGGTMACGSELTSLSGSKSRHYCPQCAPVCAECGCDCKDPMRAYHAPGCMSEEVKIINQPVEKTI